jgi:ATP-binding cassette subfamily B multidrug efflux pump
LISQRCSFRERSQANLRGATFDEDHRHIHPLNGACRWGVPEGSPSNDNPLLPLEGFPRMFRFLAKLVDPFAPYDEATPAQTAWSFLLQSLKPFRTVAGLSLTFTVLAAIVEVWLIYFAGRLVDVLAVTQPSELWTRYGSELLVALAVLLLRPLLWFLREGLDDVAFKPNAEALIRWRAHRHVLQQPVGWFRNDLSGRIASWVRQTGTAATGAAYALLHTVAFVLVYIIGSFWLMAAIDPRLAIPLLIWTLLYLGLMAYVVPRYRQNSARYQEANSELTGLLVDAYGNIDTIKLFADDRAGERKGRSVFGAALDSFYAVQRYEVMMNGGMMLLGSFLVLGLIGYALLLWQAGAAPLGLIGTALALSFRITSMAEWLLDAMSSLFGHLGSLRQALKTVAQPLALIDAPGAAELAIEGGGIRFIELSHHYGKGDGGLDRLSLEIAPAERVGIVGRSGAGKSTLVNLLLRFFAPEAGRIEIDGTDIASVTQESLRRQISMVTQEAALLHRSVGENIAFGRSGATEDEIEAAARKAAADGFIPKLRDEAGRLGYDAYVGERGVILSGGQRQRIALARALLKDAPILVLDEATSALDSEVEAAIQETLDELMAGKTVIAIAHRLSTIARMDRIIVLDEGRVVEDGTHAGLLAQGGLYASLWARQAGGFLGN